MSDTWVVNDDGRNDGSVPLALSSSPIDCDVLDDVIEEDFADIICARPSTDPDCGCDGYADTFQRHWRLLPHITVRGPIGYPVTRERHLPFAPLSPAVVSGRVPAGENHQLRPLVAAQRRGRRLDVPQVGPSAG
ncbi:hypothetical protein [Streptomyces griseorubiginosus]|uniref:hypothetical protein n=1 Tax=Streptomyces griseorubiginosus TaxID=67304 RepID=UPI0036E3F9BC